MFKKALVITDNLYLCKSFFEIIKKKHTKCFFTFAISPFSNIEDFNFLTNKTIKVFNLKNQGDVKYILQNFDLVFSIHCKQIFPDDLLKNVKCINVHPGYNPINRGWYPQVFSIINKHKIGATIHEIDDKLDHGPIITRELVEKSNYDTSETLYNKIVAKEIELLDKHIENIINNKYETIMPEDEGNLYHKKDFNEILELDLKERVLIGDFIDKLRALTHGNFKNAYYIDPETERKIYISIQLRPEVND